MPSSASRFGAFCAGRFASSGGTNASANLRRAPCVCRARRCRLDARAVRKRPRTSLRQVHVASRLRQLRPRVPALRHSSRGKARDSCGVPSLQEERSQARQLADGLLFANMSTTRAQVQAGRGVVVKCHRYNPPGVCRRVEREADGHPLPLALTLGQPCTRSQLTIHPRTFRVVYLECDHRLDESRDLPACQSRGMFVRGVWRRAC